MTGTNQSIEQIEMKLRNFKTKELLTVFIDVYDNSLAIKWLASLNDILKKELFLEKNYCFFGWEQSERNLGYLCQKINESIFSINASGLEYKIKDYFTPENTATDGPVGSGLPGMKVNHDKFNNLHRYFEDLQGHSANISDYYNQANPTVRWHIRQLNLLCHETESLILSMRKSIHAPDWRRPSQLMCWLNAPRFKLDSSDYEYFGIETIARKLGGVFVGVNKAVGKHHWEVYNDEGADSRIDELTTTNMASQTEAAGDFDIEWSQDVRGYRFWQEQIDGFRNWLIDNGFDPEDKSLTLGHPQVGQVDLLKSFGTENFAEIWQILNNYLDVYSIRTKDCYCEFPYHWSDSDFVDQQIERLRTNT